MPSLLNKSRLMVVNDLRSAALLSWDQTSYMPPGGAVARGRQMATLGRLAHEKFTNPAIGKLLNDLRTVEASRQRSVGRLRQEPAAKRAGLAHPSPVERGKREGLSRTWGRSS